jgi:hypothetical protein
MVPMDDFNRDLLFSRGAREVTDLETLRATIPGCVEVEKTGESLDRLHVDYVAYLRRGAVLHIDGKARRPGAGKFWTQSTIGRHGVPNGEPDLAIETWSVRRSPTQKGRTGWTLDESSDTDLILYTFDPSDTNEFVLLSFPLLRIAARHSLQSWSRRFRLTTQHTSDASGLVSWESECCLVPACIVQDAIRVVERGRRQAALDVNARTQLELPSLTWAEIRWGGR